MSLQLGIYLLIHLKETIIQYEIISRELSSVLDYIRKKSNQKDLIEIFKLYGISTEWLQP